MARLRARTIRIALASVLAGSMVVGLVGLLIGSLLLVGSALVASSVGAGLTLMWQERSLIGQIKRIESSLTATINDTRAKQSRHEYFQEAALERIERLGASVRADAEGLLWSAFPTAPSLLDFRGGADGSPRVLMVTSNGGGMGHLTRLLAVAKHNRERFNVAFMTLSTAYDVVEKLGFSVAHYPSKEQSGLDYGSWHRGFARYFHELVLRNQVDAVVYDGTWIYRGVYEVCDRQQLPLIWSCRGLWKDETPRQQLHAWREIADALVVPAEVGVERDHTLGVEDFKSVPPVTLVGPDEVLEREQALRSLGLSGDRLHVLIQIGGGNMRDASPLRLAAINAVQALGDEWVAVVTSSPLNPEQESEYGDAVSIQRYPIAAHLRAFEFAITSAGYNTVHESLVAALPAILVPSTETLTDAQEERARLLATRGLAFEATTGDSLRASIAALKSAEQRQTISRRLSALPRDNGAPAVAQHIANVVRDCPRNGPVVPGFNEFGGTERYDY